MIEKDLDQTEKSLELPAVSRRSFLKLGAVTAGALMLPSMLGQVFPAPLARELFGGPRVAYAAPAQSDPIEIRIVSTHEVGFTVVDTRDGAAAAVPGVQVTVTSRYNQKSATGTTDKEGVAIIDIAELSEGYEPGAKLDKYAFNGRIEAHKDGYRIFKTGRIRIQGARGIAVPTRSLKAGEPNVYASLVTFDEYDVQYTTATFITTPQNKEKHVLEVELQECASEGTLGLYVQGQNEAVATADVTPSNNVAEVQLEGTFLQKGEGNTLPAGGTFALRFDTKDGSSFTFPLALAVREGIVDSLQAGNFDLDPAERNEKQLRDLEITIPESIPTIGGSTFTIWTPAWPVTFNISPEALIMIGFNSPDWGFVADDGKPAEHKWEVNPYETTKDQWQAKKDSISNMVKAYEDALGGLDPDAMSAISHVKFIPKITAAFSAQVNLQASYDWDEKLWGGFLQGLGQFIVDVDLTEQFCLGPVPVFINFHFGTGVKVGLGIGCTFKRLSSSGFEGIDWDYKHTGLVINIPISMSVSVGLGLSGVASVALRGGGSLSVFVGFTPKKKEEDSEPHVIVGAGASLDIVIQVLIVKWSCRLCGKDWPSIYDSWGKQASNSALEGIFIEDEAAPPLLTMGRDQALQAGDRLSALKRGNLFSSDSFQLFAETAEVVSNAELLKSTEFKAQALPNVKLSAEPDQPNPEFEYSYTGKMPVANCSLLGVRGVAEEGGVVPSTDAKILQGVFSDPRSKVVMYNGVPYQFRIATVVYPGNQARSRLTAQAYNANKGVWMEPKVIAFDSNLDGVNRVDMYDYDFDVDVRENAEMGAKPGFVVALAGGTRPADDQTTVTQVITNPVMSFLLLDEDLNVYNRAVWRDTESQAFSAGYHAFSCPRVALLTDKGSLSMYGVAFMHRYADNPEDVMTSKATVMLEYSMIPAGYPVPVSMATQIDQSTYDLLMSKMNLSQVAFATSIACVSEDKVNIYTLGHPKSAAGAADSFDHNDLSSYELKAWQNVKDAKIPGALRAWNGHGGYLYAENGHLLHATFDASKLQPVSLATEEVGPDDFYVESFGVSESGEYLFFASDKEGKTGQTFDENGNRQDVTSDVHQIMASKLFDDKFGEPFPFAVTEHSCDYLTEYAGDGASSVFISSCITDMSNSLADVYFTRVPHVICASPLALINRDPFVCAGQDGRFTITVRNDGNVMIKGFTAVLNDQSGNPVAEAKVSLKEDFLPSVFDKNKTANVAAHVGGYELDKAADMVQETAANGWLAPGHIATYAVTFAIPKDWEGTRQVSFSIKDAVGADVDAMSNHEKLVQFAADAKTAPTSNLDIMASTTAQVAFQDAPVIV